VVRSAKEADNISLSILSGPSVYYTQSKERDGPRCVLTKLPHPQAAHIFLYSMMNPPAESDQLKSSDMIPDFWNLLHLFWDKDRVKKWGSTIFPNSQNPNVGVERCFNLERRSISLPRTPKPTVTKRGTLRDAMDSPTPGGNVRCCGMAKLGLG
jgi:hypothetical protein